MNFESRSLMMTFGNPWCLTTASKNTLAVSFASAVEYVGAYAAGLDGLSTATSIASNPSDTGKPVIKSIDTTSQHSFGTGIGISSPFFFWLLDFHRAQVSHVRTYSLTSRSIVDQQYH
ncbi:unnamed protein product [Phytophthora fragariaefolia]|uniref:Unnamed protein product n=1 Tax=Phytophthora fragariaefolia TaxID=1490495 RepID=A0A9W6X2R8_9STRA|nr:unnamed protein product [Phytophthora fragariaefolia]